MAKLVSKEWLEEQYWTVGLDCVQIGRVVNRDPKTVWNWMKDYGIPTRPRGSNPPPVTPFGKDNPFYGRTHSEDTKNLIREARLRDGHVPGLKDGVHYMKHPAYKQENHPSWKGGITPERQSVYATPEWTEAVKAVWKRDNAMCQRCGKHHNETEHRGTFHIHHIIGFANKEKRTDPSNLVLLCKICHRWVHGKKNISKDFIQEIT